MDKNLVSSKKTKNVIENKTNEAFIDKINVSPLFKTKYSIYPSDKQVLDFNTKNDDELYKHDNIDQ